MVLHSFEGKITTAGNETYMALVAMRSFLTGRPLAVEKYRNREVVKLLARLIKENHYDLVYCDHLQMGVYEDMFPARIPLILDEHNCESELARQRAESSTNFLKTAFLSIEYEKLKKFEAHIVSRAKKVIVLSEQDKTRLIENGSSGDFVLIPIGVEDRGIKKYRSERNPMRLLFLGTLTWEPNVSGIDWFLNKVYPNLEDVKLVIAGKGVSSRLRDKALSVGAEVLGYIESVDEVYERCDVMIVPLFMGSGQRVKIIEAFSKGMPVVTTSIGVEGIHVEDRREVLIADTSNHFVKSICALKSDGLYYALANNARSKYEHEYSIDAVVVKIAATICKTMNSIAGA